MFCYEDVLLRRHFVGRRYVEETFFVHMCISMLMLILTSMCMLHVHVHAAFPCPCCMFMLMLLVHVDAAYLCGCCMSLSTPDVYFDAACCMTMSVLHAHACVHAASMSMLQPSPFCMFISVLHAHVYVLQFHAVSKLHVYAVHVPCQYCMSVLQCTCHIP